MASGNLADLGQSGTRCLPNVAVIVVQRLNDRWDMGHAMFADFGKGFTSRAADAPVVVTEFRGHAVAYVWNVLGGSLSHLRQRIERSLANAPVRVVQARNDFRRVDCGRLADVREGHARRFAHWRSLSMESFCNRGGMWCSGLTKLRKGDASCFAHDIEIVLQALRDFGRVWLDDITSNFSA